MKKTLFLKLVLCLTLVVSFSACVNQKEIAYFQKGIGQSDTVDVSQAYIPTIQPGDILAITVGSLNPVASSFFNPFSSTPVTENTTGGNNGNTAQPALTQTAAPGFLVDVTGFIELPLLGSIKVAGLTTVQAKEILKQRLDGKYLKEPTVNVRVLNYKVSIMGEVAKPGVYVIPNEKITLPEALSMAGDLTIFGKRNNVMLIRDNNGKKEFNKIDLTSRNLYSSPFYYLHSNDVIYVEPTKGRIAQTDKTYQIIPIVLSALSFFAIILTYSRR